MAHLNGQELYDNLETTVTAGDGFEDIITLPTFSSTSQLIPCNENINANSKDTDSVGQESSFDENEYYPNSNPSQSEIASNAFNSTNKSTSKMNAVSKKQHNQLYALARQYNVSKKTVNQCKVDAQQLKNFKSIFDYIDIDSSNSIEVEEIMTLLKRIGDPLSKEQLISLMQKVDLDGSGELEFSEFLVMMAGSLSLQFNRKDLIDAFQFFSTNSQNKNIINVEDLRFALTMLFPVTKHSYKSKEHPLRMLAENQSTQATNQINGGNFDNDEASNQTVTDDNMLDETVKRTDIKELLDLLDADVDGNINIENFLENIM